MAGRPCGPEKRQGQGVPGAGLTGTHEAQNRFTVKGRIATIAGKPDPIARQGNLFWVTDVKGGWPWASDLAQVMIYMYLLPVARPDLRGTTLNGLEVYGSHEQEIQPEEVDPAFIQSLQVLMSCVKNYCRFLLPHRRKLPKSQRLGPLPAGSNSGIERSYHAVSLETG